jgi:uncharacterized protein (TIGR00304 family)
MIGLATAGVLFVLVGFAVAVLSMFFSGSGTKTELKGGGVVMIGPIPIIFGSDAKWASVAIALAMVLILVYFILWVA